MAFERGRHPGWLLGLLAAIAALVFIMSRAALFPDGEILAGLAKHYRIPPTFGQNRVLYGTVLALMLTMGALAFGALIENMRFCFLNPNPWRFPAKVALVNESILLAAVLCSIVPDVIVLLAWGELMPPSTAALSRWDRIFDGIGAVLFLFWVLRRLRARPTLVFMLQREPIPMDLEPSWDQLRPKLLIVFVITIISFGVAFGK